MDGSRASTYESALVPDSCGPKRDAAVGLGVTIGGTVGPRPMLTWSCRSVFFERRRAVSTISCNSGISLDMGSSPHSLILRRK